MANKSRVTLIICAFVAVVAVVALYFFLRGEGFYPNAPVVIAPPVQTPTCYLGMPWWAYMLYCAGQQPGSWSPSGVSVVAVQGAAAPSPVDPGNVSNSGQATTTSTSTSTSTTTTTTSDANPGPAPGPSPSSGTVAIPNDGTIDTDWNNWKYEVKGKRLTLNGKPIRFKGVNWYGFEEMQMLPELLFDSSMDTIFKTLASIGINGIRVPISAEFMQYFQNPDCKVGSEGVIIASGKVVDNTFKELFDVSGKPGSRFIVKQDKLEPAPAGNKNVCKYSYFSDPQDKTACDGKPPAVALDYFLKMAYKYNMLVKFDLHTMKATPPWNDHVINAGYELVTPDANKAKLENYLVTMEEIQSEKDGLNKKLADFAYPGLQPVWFQTHKYRDITQTKLLQFTIQEIATLWGDFAKWCLKYPHVFAFDFKNEPHDADTSKVAEPWQGIMDEVHGPIKKVNWQNWKMACDLCYDAINAVHPHACYIISGLHDRPDDDAKNVKATHGTCWGAGYSSINGDIDLVTPDATKHPKNTPIEEWQYLPKIPKNKRIWGPHQYGALASKEMSTATDWEFNWGFLSKMEECCSIDEWGQTNDKHVQAMGKKVADEQTFMSALIKYIIDNEIDSFYFAVNYTSADTEPVITEGPALNDKVVQIIKDTTPAPTVFDLSTKEKVKG